MNMAKFRKKSSPMYENLKQVTNDNSRVTGRNMDHVTEKWSRQLNAINEGLEGNADDYRLLSTAILLENTDNFLQRYSQMRGLNEATNPSDVSYFKRYAINLLSAVIPNLIAPEIVSLQPMLSRVGEVRYLKVLYGSDKAPVTKGSTMFESYTAGDFSQHNYTSDAIEGELFVGDGTTTKFDLAWTPIVPRSISGAIGTVEITDDGIGNIKNASTGDIVATVNYGTGEIAITPAPEAAVELEFSYEYNNMESPVQAPEINLKLVTSPIMAKSRKLKALYSFDASFDLSNDYGMTMNTELVGYAASQIKHEIDMEIINDLYTKATAPGITWNMIAPEGVSLVDHYNSFPIALTEAGNKMYFSTKMASPNFYIVGESASNVIESLARFKSSGAIDPKGPYLVGWLGEKPVYKSPSIPVDGFLCGFKGTSLFEAGYIYAPYMPIMNTQLLVDETFTGKQGFATSYGKKLTNGNFYSACQITQVPRVITTQSIQ
jgi:hypothetical protein